MQVSLPESQRLMPFAHTPFIPVSQAVPPPEHSTPSTLVTRSVKSSSLPPKMSSQAK